jgi:hypothetical protein
MIFTEMCEKAVIGDDLPQPSYVCCNVWVGRVLFTALKEIDKLLALIGSVWEGGNIGREGVCSCIQKNNMEFVQGSHGILRCSGREHLDMRPIILLQGILKMTP